MCEYKTIFNKMQKAFDDEHFCNKSCRGRNVKIDFINNGVFIAMVGAPGRGKSHSFSIIQSYLSRFQRNVNLYNAGDFRRVWEKEIKKHYKSNVSGFIKMCYDKKLTEERVLDTYEAELLTWLSGRSRAIPGSVFSHFKNLNEAFAQLCIKSAMAQVKSGEIIVLDATNTDVPRRDYIIQQFKKLKKDNVNLLFIENICFNEPQLKKNFASKLLDSDDYKKAVSDVCEPEVSKSTPLKKVIHDVITDHNLLTLPCIKLKKDFTECERVILESMKDITTRDMGYLKKYTPMHVSIRNKSKSTVYTIRQHKKKNIGYVQLLNVICRSGSKKQHSLYTTNVENTKGNLIEYLANVDVTKEIKASYGQEQRVKVSKSDIETLLPK